MSNTTFQACCREVAEKYDIDSFLFGGVYSSYFAEAAQLYADRRVEEAMRWIPVSERMPDNKAIVMVSCEHGVTMAEYTELKNGNRMWWVVTSIGTYDDSQEAYKVTHWMPKPTQP